MIELNIRSDEEFLAEFDTNLPVFQWFIEENFKPTILERILRARKKEQVQELKDLLNDIWFYLPDNKFNILVNPKGWSEFLSLIEV